MGQKGQGQGGGQGFGRGGGRGGKCRQGQPEQPAQADEARQAPAAVEQEENGGQNAASSGFGPRLHRLRDGSCARTGNRG